MRDETVRTRRWTAPTDCSLCCRRTPNGYGVNHRHNDALSLSDALNIDNDDMLGTAVTGYIGEQWVTLLSASVAGPSSRRANLLNSTGQCRAAFASAVGRFLR